MGIGSVTSFNSMSSMQMTTPTLTDTKSKSIQNEIKDVQQQMQNLSSKEDLSVNEKTTEREKLQKEKSSLNTELKQHEETLRKSQKREIMMAQLQEEQKPAKEEKTGDKTQAKETSLNQTDEKKLPADRQQAKQQETVIVNNNDGKVTLKGSTNQDEKRGAAVEQNQTAETTSSVTDEKNLSADKSSITAMAETKEKVNTEEETKAIDDDKDNGLSSKEIHAIVSAEAFVRQSDRQEAVIAKIDDDIVILKSEMNLDEKRGVNTERKESELEKLERQRAMASQFSVYDNNNRTPQTTAKTNVFGTQYELQVNINNNAIRASREESQASQQMFYSYFQ